MTTIFETVVSALEALLPAVPFALAPYQSADGTLPDLFLTYSLIDGVPEQHADNVETQRSYRVQVSIYSRTGLASLPDVDTAMTAAGFTLGPERQLPFDDATHHFGLAKDYFYLQ